MLRISALCGTLSLSALSLAVPLAAQEINLHGPLTGFIYDESSRSVRPILGLAGAAHLGPSVYSDLDYASIAPNGRFALVVRSGQVAFIDDLTKPQPEAGLLEGAVAAPNRILWAADSSAAILCSRDAVQRVAGLPAAPVFEQPVTLPSAPRGRMVTLAADSPARSIAVAIRGRTGGSLFLISESGDGGQLGGVKDPAAATFSQDGLDLFVADRGTQQILFFHAARPGSSGKPVLDASDAVGLAIFGNQLLVVGGSGLIRSYDLPALTLSRGYSLESRPEGIEPVAGSPYYRLTSRRNTGEILWLLDLRRDPPVFFVPAGD